MKINDLITMAKSRLVHLRSMRESAVRVGDFQGLMKIDQEIDETESTLAQLETIAG
jgi:hypothetical protein